MKNPDELGKRCWFCRQPVKNRWAIQLRNRKGTEGLYCSKPCAIDDAWGPRYKGSKPVRLKD